MLEARATGEHGRYYPAALSVINDILSENPPKDVIFGAKSLKASVMLSLHEFEKAKELAREAIAINGYKALVYGSLADAHVELGDCDEAVNMADKMMSIRPDIHSYSRVSYLREIHGDMDGAINAMKLAVEAGYPGYEETAWAGLILGELLEKKGQLEEDRKIYEGILKERPNYPFAIDALAGIKMKYRNYEKAEKLVRKACSIIPEVGFYEHLADIYQQTGREKQADATLEEVLEMLADDEAHGHKMSMEYARLYLELMGDYEKALDYAGKEYQNRPENKDVNQLVAAIYMKLGADSVAEKYVKKALSTGSTDAERLTMEALLLVKEGKTGEARQKIQSLFDSNPYQNHTFFEEAKNFIGA